MANAIDRYMGLEWLKRRVDAAHKEAKADAEAMLSEQRAENGVMELTSPAFGAEAGSYKFKKTRRKKVVEYNVTDKGDLRDWMQVEGNAAADYAAEHAEDFARFWFDLTGEVPDGIARVEYEEPPRVAAPQLYGFHPDVVESRLGGNLLEATTFLLEGGTE